jgi:hypothetical protein
MLIPSSYSWWVTLQQTHQHMEEIVVHSEMTERQKLAQGAQPEFDVHQSGSQHLGAT